MAGCCRYNGPPRKQLPVQQIAKPPDVEVPVFVMLPLDAVDPVSHLPKESLQDQLNILSITGVKGIMMDVWYVGAHASERLA
jgi:hypothetical protein